MAAIADILHHIAQELGYRDAAAAALAMRSANTVAVRICVTYELEETELNYLLWFGHGHTIYVRIEDAREGKKLIGELAYSLPNVRAIECQHAPDEGAAQRQLYLFIHVQEGLCVQPERETVSIWHADVQPDCSTHKTTTL